ncbi:MAG: hypothetical protein E7672_00855 [Ruminococcaceae bacterium]|nr:hypothetical protein [Oscillospiraceae bacterium]
MAQDHEKGMVIIVKKLTVNINSYADAEELVKKSEAEFTAHINKALDEVFDNDHHRLIALSGPSCSGKTTTASMLTERITSEGQNAVVMSIDDFFFGRSDRNKVDIEAPDYDSVKAIDLDYLGEFTKDLLAGKTVRVPKYSFLETARVGYREYYPRENDIYIFEGIQAVYPEVTALFGNNYESVFISVEDDIEYNGTVFTKHEIRLFRRIVRDYKFRNATAEFTLHLWEGVRANEENNIFPNSQQCDVYINSFLPYELFVIAPYATDLLRTIPSGSRYRAEAERLMDKLSIFKCDYIEDRMIPANSVFREFIG